MISPPLAAIATTPGISFASHFWRNRLSISDLVCMGVDTSRLLFWRAAILLPRLASGKHAPVAWPGGRDFVIGLIAAAPLGGTARLICNTSPQLAVDELQGR